MNKPLLKWSPAVPIRKPDNLISSQAEPAFIPSYKSEKRENMNFIMSNEYMRMWFQERSVYERNIYTRQQIIKEESRIKRRIIQRLMTYKNPTKNQNIEDSVERRILRDTALEKKRLNMKFKIECPRKSNSNAGDKAAQEKEGIKNKYKNKKNEGNATQKLEDNDDGGACLLECEQEKLIN